MKDLTIESLVLNFDLDCCSFISDDKAVIFSPFTCESLLCDKSVYDLLKFLSEENKNDYFVSIPEAKSEVLDKLLSMRIIKLKE
ncbi:hypothetical protein BIZ37_19360 [Photobacterium sp. BZF1]|uniref:hypothetical protein n=1 Tax=Photobacterium sp. BZF1 TaxID=1904457 RepID=UPI001653EE8B|nr:hypothetical protein [Photobacterium sp. BZF1]MBC7004724.1 hypothetical protein [Photobacterium sp. BZF1]